jgi:RNA polymerase sigma factor for flagellar operon FliA
LATRAAHRPANLAPATVVPRAARVKKARGLDPQLSAQLLLQYEPLVRKIAGGFQRKLPRNVLREDLIAAGMSGLWDAIRRHPDGPTESFEWYVRVRIRGAILDELRAQDWLPRRARAAAEAASGTDAYVPPPAVVRFDDVSEWEQNRCLADASSSEAAVAAKFAQETLAKAVEQLPERERHIVSQHYFRGVKFKDLGVELGVSEPRISQLHSRAIQRLKLIIKTAA